jgi:predicted RNase H-like HicB family nuclease
MNLTIETETETEIEAHGRWIAEVPELPGAMAYGATEQEAAAKAEALALRILADRLDHNEAKPLDVTIRIQAAE